MKTCAGCKHNPFTWHAVAAVMGQETNAVPTCPFLFPFLCHLQNAPHLPLLHPADKEEATRVYPAGEDTSSSHSPTSNSGELPIVIDDPLAHLAQSRRRIALPLQLPAGTVIGDRARVNGRREVWHQCIVGI